MKALPIIGLLLLIGSVQAIEYKVDVGVTQFTKTANGNWYQNDFPNTEHLTSPSASIKVYTDKTTDGWQVGGGFDYIGRASSDATIVDCDSYGSGAHPMCNGGPAPFSHMHGQGTIPSAFVMVRKSWNKWFTEGGVYATRAHWETTNFDWYGGPNNTIGPVMSHLNHAPETIYGLGVSLGYQIEKNVAIMLKVEPTHTSGLVPGSNTEFPGIYKAYSPTLAVEYTF